MKLLIAEDEYTTRLMVQVSLEKWGYQVESVIDGKEAWDTLKKPNGPHIAILDWEMPEIDGVEVCRRVKDLERDNPVYVILLTGRDGQNDILHGFDAGADDYMTKPFNDDELRARVRVAERLVRIQSSLSESNEELRLALDLVDTMQGNVPVCARCCKIEGDDGLWYTVENCINDHFDPRFIHAVCPECMKTS